MSRPIPGGGRRFAGGPASHEPARGPLIPEGAAKATGEGDAAPLRAGEAGERIVLASWNVHGWIGRDGVRDPSRAFAVIRDLDADIAALQEVEGSDWRSLSRAAGYEPILGRTGAAYGNALLVRVPLVSVRRLDLSVPGRERRGALDAVASPSGEPLRIVATHLGLRSWERRRQAAALANHLDERDAGLPVALLGDLNDWTPWGSQLRPLARCVGPLSRIPTFPSQRPVLPLDRAAWRAPHRAARLTAVRSPAVRSASDHLPLRLELGPRVPNAE